MGCQFCLTSIRSYIIIQERMEEVKKLQAVGIEPTTFCVLSRCDNHYTTLADVKMLFGHNHPL